jgi:hypothetical protein
VVALGRRVRLAGGRGLRLPDLADRPLPMTCAPLGTSLGGRQTGEGTVASPKTKRELADVEGKIVAETEKAYKFDNGTRVVWLPKSQCEWDEQDKKLTMPMWLATEKELV